jgi:transcriptional regulator with XRE-family HTH domain
VPRRVRGQRRTPFQIRADGASNELVARLGKALRAARTARGLTQRQIAEAAGVRQSTISAMERARTTSISLLVWERVARACGSELNAYIRSASGASEPRDRVHLATQELVLRTAALGGWREIPEAAIDDGARGSRSVDVLLERVASEPDVGKAPVPTARSVTSPDWLDRGDHEIAVIEIIDWFDDVGAALRDWDRRLARVSPRAVAATPAMILGPGRCSFRSSAVAGSSGRHSAAEHSLRTTKHCSRRGFRARARHGCRP